MRDSALSELCIIAGLRRRGHEIGEEADKMPILNDIGDHDYIGPMLKRERIEERMELLLAQLSGRFGTVPPRTRKRLAALQPDELKVACLRILDAKKIDDVFPA